MGFDMWPLSIPHLPPRSDLAPIEPIGVGTGLVEGLTSYIMRLAEAHSVSTGDLVRRELATVPEKDTETTSRKRESATANGNCFRNSQFDYSELRHKGGTWLAWHCGLRRRAHHHRDVRNVVGAV